MIATRNRFIKNPMVVVVVDSPELVNVTDPRRYGDTCRSHSFQFPFETVPIAFLLPLIYMCIPHMTRTVVLSVCVHGCANLLSRRAYDTINGPLGCRQMTVQHILLYKTQVLCLG